MAHALPRPIEHRLQQTLAQWPHWQCAKPLRHQPPVLQILSEGISNFSVLVGHDERFVVRIDGAKPELNGLNRRAEWRALQSAHLAGLAPCPRYFNPALGTMVCDYLRPNPDTSPGPAQVAALLSAIHALPARHQRLDLGERVLRYEKQLARRGHTTAPLDRCRLPIANLLQTIGQRRTPSVLCHNDLLRSNRIWHGESLWAIDWEYCAMGDPLYDLAVVIEGDCLPQHDAALLVQHYLGRHPAPQEKVRLHRYGLLYRYLEILWYLAQPTPLMDTRLLHDKAEALLQELITANHEDW